MDNYELKKDEVVLLKDNVSVSEYNGTCEFLLTNVNIVLIKRTKKLFQKEDIAVKIFLVSDIKIHNDIPQIKKNTSSVEIYFSSCEIMLTFESKYNAKKFVSKATELITGKSLSIRGAEKVKNTLGLINDTIGINTVETATYVMKNGLANTILNGTKKRETKVSSKANAIKETVNLANELLGKNHSNTKETNHEKNMSYDEKIDAVKKLKELLDKEILTQEEFDKKKSEILEL